MLRMRLVAFDRPPFGRIAPAIKSRQNHRAAVERGHNRDQLGHCRNATGEPRGDDRVGRREATPGCSLSFEEAVAPHRWIEGTLGGEDLRPLARYDLEKLVDDLPMCGEV